jgi:JmjC domain, hydroxylase
MTEPDEESDRYLSNHCVAMRRALQHCLDKSRDLKTSYRSSSIDGQEAHDGDRAADDGTVRHHLRQAQDAARDLPRYRSDNLDSFHASALSENERPSIAVLETLSQTSPFAFRRAFEHANLPCKVVLGLPNNFFGKVQQHWVVKRSRNRSGMVSSHWRDRLDSENAAGSTSTRQAVNRSWFVDTLGPETAVPVRTDPMSAAAAQEACPDRETAVHVPAGVQTGPDADGRATESETKNMALREWIGLLDSANTSLADQGERATDAARLASVASLYLKDWHLQSIVNRHNRTTARSVMKNTKDDESTNVSVVTGLYRVPALFGHDLLNHFLTTFFVDDDGNYISDYYFCYWGPAGSQTLRHSDVLNSFSWSYNVCGHKEWTFYPPPLPTSGNEPNPAELHHTAEKPIVLHQWAGECVFVPSGWQHSVVNCEETLSLNHNCVTTANIDLVWSCLCQEIRAIERELAAWDAPALPSPSGCRSSKVRADGFVPFGGSEVEECDWDAQESMLRGCVGLDVSAFYLMITFGIVERITRSSAESDGAWEFVFDLTRLKDTLQLMLQSDSLHLAQRLQASLGDHALAMKAHEMGDGIIEYVNERMGEVLGTADSYPLRFEDFR